MQHQRTGSIGVVPVLHNSLSSNAPKTPPKRFPLPPSREQCKTLACYAFVLGISYYMAARGACLRPFLTMTDKTPWVWEITSFGYFLKIALDSKAAVKDMYFAQAVVQTAINAFGGGFLAPLIVCHCPVPLMEETFLWMVVLAWYIVHHVPLLSEPIQFFSQSLPGKVLFAVLFGIFKTNQIVGGVELAENSVRHEPLVAHSRYFTVTPYAAPFMCGFLSGCGGAFLPFEKGLMPLEKGQSWPVRSSFFATLFYYLTTRLAHMDKLNAKMLAMIFRMLGDLFPVSRDNVINPATKFLHDTLETPRGKKEAV